MNTFITDFLVANNVEISTHEPTLMEVHLLIQKLDKILSSIPVEYVLQGYIGNVRTTLEHLNELLNLGFIDPTSYKIGEIHLTESGLLATIPEDY